MSYESYVVVVGFHVGCGLIGAISVIHVFVFLLILKCMKKAVWASLHAHLLSVPSKTKLTPCPHILQL